MLFNRAFDRRVTIGIHEVAERKGEKTASASLMDPVHHMTLIAGVSQEGVLKQACSNASGKPFVECGPVISQSGDSVWTGVNLNDARAIEAIWKQARGCEHIAELVKYLAHAFRLGINELRLELKSLLLDCSHKTSGKSCRSRTVLTASVRGELINGLTVEMDVMHRELGLASDGSRVINLHKDIGDLRPNLLGRKPQEARRILEATRNGSQEVELLMLLLQLYRETHRAILAPGSGRVTPANTLQRRAAFVVLRELIEGGTVPTIRCGAFEGAGIRGPGEALHADHDPQRHHG